MSGNGLHVIPMNGKWSVRRAGAARASAIHGTREEAIEHARRMAQSQRAILYVHAVDGRIRARIRLVKKQST